MLEKGCCIVGGGLSICLEYLVRVIYFTDITWWGKGKVESFNINGRVISCC